MYVESNVIPSLHKIGKTDLTGTLVQKPEAKHIDINGNHVPEDRLFGIEYPLTGKSIPEQQKIRQTARTKNKLIHLADPRITQPAVTWALDEEKEELKHYGSWDQHPTQPKQPDLKYLLERLSRLEKKSEQTTTRAPKVMEINLGSEKNEPEWYLTDRSYEEIKS